MCVCVSCECVADAAAVAVVGPQSSTQLVCGVGSDDDETAAAATSALACLGRRGVFSCALVAAASGAGAAAVAPRERETRFESVESSLVAAAAAALLTLPEPRAAASASASACGCGCGSAFAADVSSPRPWRVLSSLFALLGARKTAHSRRPQFCAGAESPRLRRRRRVLPLPFRLGRLTELEQMTQ